MACRYVTGEPLHLLNVVVVDNNWEGHVLVVAAIVIVLAVAVQGANASATKDMLLTRRRQQRIANIWMDMLC